MSAHVGNVLVIDDNVGDAVLVLEALQEADAAIDAQWANGGERAIAALAARCAFRDRGDPQLILLDLNMPGISGHDLLAAVRGVEAWDDVPIYVLSSTRRGPEIERVLATGADRYIHKPNDWSGYLAFATAIARQVRHGDAWCAPGVESQVAEVRDPRLWRERIRQANATSRLICAESRLQLEASRRSLEHCRRRMP